MTKLVIVLRRDLVKKDGRPASLAKLAVQACHACTFFLTAAARGDKVLTEAQLSWASDRVERKILVWADSEEHLLALKRQADEAGVESNLVTDLGLTEFAGPTITALGVGPDFPARIDPITGGLKLVRD